MGFYIVWSLFNKRDDELKDNREKSIEKLEAIAKKVRIWVLKSINAAGSGHPGGSLSSTDILVALYFNRLKHDPKDLSWAGRDRFVLSKGHAAPALYACLALNGYFSEDDLPTLRKMDSHLQGHPCMRKTPGVEMSTGSLGQGLSVAVGMALASKLDKRDIRIFTLLGDGECQEGQIWEAAMSAAHYSLDNLTAFLDRNGLQIDGPTKEIMNLEPLEEKFRAFGWHVITIDGHDFRNIIEAIGEGDRTRDRPTMIIADTIKGKGISFMEHSLHFHGNPPNSEELDRGMKECLGGECNE